MVIGQRTDGTGRIRPLRPTQFPQPVRRLDLQETFSVLWYRKWSILIVTVVTVGLALLVSSRQTAIYETQASVLVTPIEAGNETVPIEVPNLATEAELITSVTVARIVAENLGTEGPPVGLLQDLDVDQPTDTEILQIRYRDPNPNRAQALAGGFAEGYLEFRETAASMEILERARDLESEISALEQRLEDIDIERLRLPAADPRRSTLDDEAAALRDLILQAQIERIGLPQEVTGGRIIQPASLPTSPVSPNHLINGLLGFIAGLALGIVQALMRERMSGRLRSSEEVEDYLDAPVLAVIPRIPGMATTKAGALDQPVAPALAGI